MVKRKSVGSENVDKLQPSTSKKAHRTDSSSSSTGDEWLCASTRVPLPGEALSLSATSKGKRFPPASLSSRKIGKTAARRLSAPSPTLSLGKDDSTVSAETESSSCTTPASSSRRSSSSFFGLKKPPKLLELRRTSLLGPSTSKNSPRFRKAPANTTSEAASKWPSFSSVQRRNVVLELSPSRTKSSIRAEHSISFQSALMEDTMVVEESPLKTSDWNRPAERTPSPAKHASVESVVADSQRSAPRTIRTRSLENCRRGAFPKIAARKEVTWPTPFRPASETPAAKSEVSSNVATQLVLDSSPDEKSDNSRSNTVQHAVSSVETRSSASGDVIAATQELVTESDDEYHLRSERYDIDEVSRLHSNNPSSEKRDEEEGGEQSASEEDESSSDEDDTITRSSIARMNLTGVAREFAEYMLARRSERLMIKRDPNVPTATYEVLETVSAWGMSVSWLSPKAVMFAPPFARDPATVTLALPLLTIPNKYDPETPFILNPVIVSTTQDVTVSESVAV